MDRLLSSWILELLLILHEAFQVIKPRMEVNSRRILMTYDYPIIDGKYYLSQECIGKNIFLAKYCFTYRLVQKKMPIHSSHPYAPKKVGAGCVACGCCWYLLPPSTISLSTFSNSHISTTTKSLEVLKVIVYSYGLDLSIKHHLVGQCIYHSLRAGSHRASSHPHESCSCPV